jgi:hypothetical protein
LSVSRLDSSAGILFSVFGDARAGRPRSGFVHWGLGSIFSLKDEPEAE